MDSSSIDFSAQFGGRDAAAAVLPHFKFLKAAAHGLRLEGFPFPKLAFILRVDGEVTCYGLSGSGNSEIDKDGEYLSVDIGITRGDRDRIYDLVSSAILSSCDQIRSLVESKSWEVDFHALQNCLVKLITRYKCELQGQSNVLHP